MSFPLNPVPAGLPNTIFTPQCPPRRMPMVPSIWARGAFPVDADGPLAIRQAAAAAALVEGPNQYAPDAASLPSCAPPSPRGRPGQLRARLRSLSRERNHRHLRRHRAPSSRRCSRWRVRGGGGAGRADLRFRSSHRRGRGTDGEKRGARRRRTGRLDRSRRWQNAVSPRTAAILINLRRKIPIGRVLTSAGMLGGGGARGAGGRLRGDLRRSL